MHLAATDARAILDFLADVDTIGADEPYSAAFLTRLRDVVPCVDLTFQDADLEARRFIAAMPEEQSEEEAALYWAVGPCPITLPRPDGRPPRAHDVGRDRQAAVPRAAALPGVLPAFWTRPCPGRRLSMANQELRSLVLFRAADDPDFSGRDRDVLDSLRPHLRAREARAELYQRTQAGSLLDAAPGDLPEPLTPREREVIYLAAQGKSNAEITSVLWVTPGTVKKHLENIYGKLDVGSRAAAVSHVQAASLAG